MKPNGNASESEYIKILRERYAPCPDADLDYDNPKHQEYLLARGTPEQYGVEPQMLEYVKAYPDVSIKELLNHLVSLLPPIVITADADDEEEDEDDD